MLPARCRRCLLMMLASLGLAAAPLAFGQIATEQAVRAAMLFNFLKFTEWPVAGEGPLKVCVASGDPELMAAMSALRERQIRGRPLVTERHRQQADCDVIYVDSRQAWSGMAERPARALTIGGYGGFVGDGGMIEISFQDGRARFDIHLAEGRRAGLRFYPQLLRLARRVVE